MPALRKTETPVPGEAPPPLLTERQAAAWLKMPLTSFRSIRYRGDGPPEFKVGRHLRFRPAALEAWVVENTKDHPPSKD